MSHGITIVMKIEDLSKRKRRFVELAARSAEQSCYGSLRHGAVLIKGGSVLNVANNKENYCSFGDRFRERGSGRATLHAELACVLNLDRRITHGGTMYVVRVGKDGKHKMSKPCTMCEAVLKHVGVNKVYYSTNEETLEMIKL
jgi:tRNA(Arg) A34 adenosine deaminase TadA